MKMLTRRRNSNGTYLNDAVYGLLEREAPIFLDDGLMRKFKVGERLTEGDKEDLRDFRDYMVGFFPSDRRRIKRMVLHYLNRR